MGLYKYYDPVTGTRKPIKSGSIVNMDGTNEYTPDEVKEIDDKIGILSGVSGTKEKANKEDLDSHKEDLDSHKEDLDSHLAKKVNRNGDTMTGVLKAQSNIAYATAQTRNIILSTSNADVNLMQNGEIWIKYV